MLDDISEKLHTFFLPQVEQLGMVEEQTALGGRACLRQDMGNGYLWVLGLGDGCLLSVHDFTLREPFLLREYPKESYCLSIMSHTVVEAVPMFSVSPARQTNTLTLHQEDAETQFTLPGNVRCWAATCCFMPEYLDQLAVVCGVEAEAIRDAIVTAIPGQLPRTVTHCLEALYPSRTHTMRSQPFYAAKVFEALSLLVDAYLSQQQTGTSSRIQSETQLVNEALRIMDERLSEKLTLSHLAKELYVSKTTLCEAFRHTQQSSPAACLAMRRMERARELLQDTDLTGKEIAAVVGFAHQSTFSDAFKRAFGMRPSEVRQLYS